MTSPTQDTGKAHARKRTAKKSPAKTATKAKPKAKATTAKAKPKTAAKSDTFTCESCGAVRRTAFSLWNHIRKRREQNGHAALWKKQGPAPAKG